MLDSELQKSLGQEKVPQDGSRYAELTALSPEMVIEVKKRG